MRLAIPLGLITLLTAAPAGAQTVKITLNPDAQRLATQMMLDTAALEGLIAQQLRAVYSLADTDNFLRMSANAQSMASKGLGADYSSDIGTFVFGFGLNAAADAGNADLSTIADTALGNFDRAVPVAAGLQFSLMAGLEVTDGLLLYVNGMAYPVTGGKLSGSGHNFGVHAQYRLLSGIGTKLVAEWGGIALTGGLEISKSTLTLEESFDAPVPLSPDIDLHADTTGTIELTQKALTIPLEITTSLRLLYFLTIYGGAGIDIQMGKASITLNVDSKLNARGNADATYDLGTAEVDFLGEQDPNRVMIRLLAGLAATVGPLSAFAQLNMATNDLTVGVAAGVRVAI